MKIRPYITLSMQLQALVVLAAVPLTVPSSVSRAGSDRSVAEWTRPATRPLADSAPFDSLRCGILVGDGLRHRMVGRTCDDTPPSSLRV